MQFPKIRSIEMFGLPEFIIEGDLNYLHEIEKAAANSSAVRVPGEPYSNNNVLFRLLRRSNFDWVKAEQKILARMLEVMPEICVQGSADPAYQIWLEDKVTIAPMEYPIYFVYQNNPGAPPMPLEGLFTQEENLKLILLRRRGLMYSWFSSFVILYHELWHAYQSIRDAAKPMSNDENEKEAYKQSCAFAENFLIWLNKRTISSSELRQHIIDSAALIAEGQKNMLKRFSQ